MLIVALAALGLGILAMSGRNRGSAAAPPMPINPARTAPSVPAPNTADMTFTPEEGQRALEELENQSLSDFEESQRRPGTEGGSSIAPAMEAPDGTPIPGFQLEDELARASSAIQSVWHNRDPNIAHGWAGSGATVRQLETGIRLARAAGLTVIADELARTLAEKRARPNRDAAGPARTVRTPAVASSELPAPTIDRNALHSIAVRVYNDLLAKGYRQYDTNLMRSFQRGAGLTADGKYGARSQQALGYWGQLSAGQVPPAEW